MDKSCEDDLKVFNQSMADVAPLGKRSKSDRPGHATPPVPFTPHKSVPARTSKVPNAKPIGGQEILNWRRPGLLDKDYRDLRRGCLSPPPEREDLHGMKAQDACNAIMTAIAHTQQINRRFLCLIHGKGHHSESRSSQLKGLVNAVLREHPDVLGFHSVPGNTGAVNVLLRRPRR